MLMSSLQDLSLGLTPEVQERELLATVDVAQKRRYERSHYSCLNNHFSNIALTAGAWSKVQAVHM